jgi:two-component system LytT family response regulator
LKKRLTALIVDDEMLAREDLKGILDEFDEIEIIGEADCVDTAVEIIAKLKPELIFLDVQMPGESGFDLINKIPSDVKIIFVTAYDEFAIRAFEVNANDYLLKPVSKERLALTLERLGSEEEGVSREYRKLKYDDSVFLLFNNKYCFLRVDSIVKISTANDYTEVATSEGRKGLVSKPMREWEHRLPDQHFARVHRSTIINLQYIDKIEDWFNYSYRVYLKGFEKPVVMSRRYASNIKKRFG